MDRQKHSLVEQAVDRELNGLLEANKALALQYYNAVDPSQSVGDFFQRQGYYCNVVVRAVNFVHDQKQAFRGRWPSDDGSDAYKKAITTKAQLTPLTTSAGLLRAYKADRFIEEHQQDGSEWAWTEKMLYGSHSLIRVGNFSFQDLYSGDPKEYDLVGYMKTLIELPYTYTGFLKVEDALSQKELSYPAVIGHVKDQLKHFRPIVFFSQAEYNNIPPNIKKDKALHDAYQAMLKVRTNIDTAAQRVLDILCNHPDENLELVRLIAEYTDIPSSFFRSYLFRTMGLAEDATRIYSSYRAMKEWASQGSDDHQKITQKIEELLQSIDTPYIFTCDELEGLIPGTDGQAGDVDVLTSKLASISGAVNQSLERGHTVSISDIAELDEWKNGMSVTFQKISAKGEYRFYFSLKDPETDEVHMISLEISSKNGLDWSIVESLDGENATPYINTLVHAACHTVDKVVSDIEKELRASQQKKVNGNKSQSPTNGKKRETHNRDDIYQLRKRVVVDGGNVNFSAAPEEENSSSRPLLQIDMNGLNGYQAQLVHEQLDRVKDAIDAFNHRQTVHHRTFAKLTKGENLYRLRVGKLRVILQLGPSGYTIRDIGQRDKIYDRNGL